MRFTSRRHWLALLALALSGCAATVDTRAQFDLAQASDTTFAQRFAHERQRQGGRAPRLGLALSGGGTKAALFAHGVLQGLNDSGLLAEVDAISSVSGGGYAAFWCYSKQLEAQRLGFDPRGIFADCFPAWWEDPKAEPALQRVFEKGRQQARAAGQPVCDTPDHWLPGGDPLRWQAHLPRWPELPLWILNTSAGDKGHSPNLGLLYELTPWGHGPPALGYRQEAPPLDSVATRVR